VNVGIYRPIWVHVISQITIDTLMEIKQILDEKDIVIEEVNNIIKKLKYV
jgi:6-phosphogluconate dehydrogenase (decarboxylating)